MRLRRPFSCVAAMASPGMMEVGGLFFDVEPFSRRLDPNDSVLLGSERVADIEALLAKGDNVVLLSNHQTEADPSCWSFALHENHERLERDMIMVAGDRVTTDVVAVPFSKARNLLCIYSKRHIDNPPEEKSKKMRHNAKTMTVCSRRLSVHAVDATRLHLLMKWVVFRSMSGPLGRGRVDGVFTRQRRRGAVVTIPTQAMLRLFKGGGKCIWVAPSGGRDRPDADGVYTPAAFDPKSVEMFRLMSAKAADKTTHFFPVAMMTHRLFPPPKTLTPGALGEPRKAIRGSVNIAIGEPIDFDEVTRAGCLVDDFPPGCVEDREDAAQVAAEYAHLQVSQLYADLVKSAKERGSPYYSADRY